MTITMSKLIRSTLKFVNKNDLRVELNAQKRFEKSVVEGSTKNSMEPLSTLDPHNRHFVAPKSFDMVSPTLVIGFSIRNQDDTDDIKIEPRTV